MNNRRKHNRKDQNRNKLISTNILTIENNNSSHNYNNHSKWEDIEIGGGCSSNSSDYEDYYYSYKQLAGGMESGRSTPSGSTTVNDIPKLAYSEIAMGRIVGRGGFSVVHEISSIELQEVYDTDEKEAQIRAALADEYNHHDDQDNAHLNSMRRLYVMKTLRDDLPDEDHTKGIVDLAVEARLLAKLSHPNIVQMRAMANSDPLESKFFVVLEYLDKTLDVRMTQWRKEIGMSMGFWMGPCLGYCCSRRYLLHQLWIDRMLVAHDIASAIHHLHQQGIVYRDLKPDNIGFDEEGVVKLFDFGLAKHLHPDDKNTVGLYMLTGNTGSLRYMAPEVALGQPYDLRVDTYSFGILFWQICALATPFAGYSVKMHQELAVEKGHRPKTDRSWPSTWSQLMKNCWSSDIFTRPTFDVILNTLDNELDDLYSQQDNIPRDIRAKNRSSNKIKAHSEGVRLDADTRLNGSTLMDQISTRRHDADIV